MLESHVSDDQKLHSPKLAVVGERPVANRGGLRGASSDGHGTADSIGAGPSVVLSCLGTLREPQSCPDRHERQLCWGCRKRQCILSRVPPGHYHIAPESFGRDFNQDRNVDLAPSQQLYLKIVSLDNWGMSVSGCKNCARCFLRLADPPGGPASWKLRWVFKSAIRFLVSLSRLAMTLRVLSGLRGRRLEHRSENIEPASGPAPDIRPLPVSDYPR